MYRKDAIFSKDRTHRYLLERQWGGGPLEHRTGRALWVMFNPSVANETEDDRTITRCVNFSKRLDCHAMSVVNLYSIIGTNPKDLPGPRVRLATDKIIDRAAEESDIVFVAWGNLGIGHEDRIKKVLEVMAWNKELFCFGINKTGHPKHPLYIKANAELKVWKEVL